MNKEQKIIMLNIAEKIQRKGRGDYTLEQNINYWKNILKSRIEDNKAELTLLLILEKWLNDNVLNSENLKYPSTIKHHLNDDKNHKDFSQSK